MEHYGSMITVLTLLAMLIAASIVDVRKHKIPNALVASGLGLGVALGLLQSGTGGLAYAVAGAGLGLACLLPFYAFGAMGAGDVKLMTAVGAFVGPVMALKAVVFTLLAGGALALAVLAMRGGLGELLGRYAFTVKHLFLAGRFVAPRAGADAISRTRMPYALAIALGTVAALWQAAAFGSSFGQWEAVWMR